MTKSYFRLIAALLAAVPLVSSAEETWYGYYDGEEKLSEFGTGIGEDYNCAIYLPGDIGMASGKSISRVRCRLQGTDGMKDLRVWLSSSLPGNVDDADLGVYTVNVGDVTDGEAFETELTKSLWVPETGLYVGYSFSATDPFPVLTTVGNTTVANGFFIRTSRTYTDWKDFTQYNYGNLAIEVLLEGDVWHNAVQVDAVGEVVSFPGENVVVPVAMTGYGDAGVSSIEYTLSEDGGEKRQFVYELPTPVTQPKESFVMNLEFPALTSRGMSYKEISVIGVNGHDNEMPEYACGRGAVITIEESAPRSVVMEEFTGTWCGWCPRGIVGLENLNKDFGNSFIGIAVHGGNDPMVIDVLSAVEGFPSCVLDREVAGDPFFGSTYGIGSEPSYGIRDDVERQLEKITPAAVALATEWGDDDKTVINVVASLRLQYPREGTPDYNIAYVICADSLKSEDPGWWQNSDFALPQAQGYKNDPYLGWLTEAGSRIRNLAYDDVAVAAYGIDRGYSLAEGLGWNGNDWCEIDSRSFGIDGNRLVQDKDRLSVVAMIIDNSDGHIVNAVKTAVGETNSSDVADIVTDRDAVIETVYDMSGRVTRGIGKGLNIVRYSDGSVRKIMVR